MPPPTSSRSTLRQQGVDDAELVGDLRAAEHHRRTAAPGRSVSLRSTSTSAQHQAAGGVRQPLRRRRRRWRACGAPRRTRRRRTTSASAASSSANAPRSASSLLVSPGSKRRFSSSATSPSAEPVDRGLGALADRVGGERDRRAEQLAEPRRRPGARRVLRVRRALRAGRGARRRPPARRASAQRRRWSAALARIRPSSVIAVAVQRHVEVGAHQHAPARARPRRAGRRASSRSVASSSRPASTRSTRRLE